MNIEELWTKLQTWFLEQGIELVVIVILAMILLKIAGMIVRRSFRALTEYQADAEAEKRLETLQSVTRYTVGIAIVITAMMMILQNLGVEISAVLAAAGVVGIAVGFGSQQLVQDVISGFFLLVENQIRVGDVVSIAGKSGLVERINLRMTVLRDLSGNVHYVRNGHIDLVTNMTKGFSYYVFDIGVAYREDTDEVARIMREVSEELREDKDFSGEILEDIEILGVDGFADSAVIVKARIKTLPIKQWHIGREFNRRLKKAFDAAGVEIPFPHITVYAGQDKDGTAPDFPMSITRREAAE
jgi:small conductance mechanosensitive channel